MYACMHKKMMKKKMSLPGIEPGTLSVLNSRDNHYTTETPDILMCKAKYVEDTNLRYFRSSVYHTNTLVVV